MTSSEIAGNRTTENQTTENQTTQFPPTTEFRYTTSDLPQL